MLNITRKIGKSAVTLDLTINNKKINEENIYKTSKKFKNNKIKLGYLLGDSNSSLNAYRGKKEIDITKSVKLKKGSNKIKLIITDSNENQNKYKLYISKSIKFVSFLSFAMCIGLISIGYNFAPLYFGNFFQKTGLLIMLLSTTIPFLAFANVLRTQYLIPKEMDKVYIKSVSLGAIVNLVFNFIFIPKLSRIGATIGNILAEISVMVYQTVAVRK